jgi:hypothetical protein
MQRSKSRRKQPVRVPARSEMAHDPDAQRTIPDRTARKQGKARARAPKPVNLLKAPKK